MQRIDRVPVPGGGTDRQFLFDGSIGKSGISVAIRAIEIYFPADNAQLFRGVSQWPQ